MTSGTTGDQQTEMPPALSPEAAAAPQPPARLDQYVVHHATGRTFPGGEARTFRRLTCLPCGGAGRYWDVFTVPTDTFGVMEVQGAWRKCAVCAGDGHVYTPVRPEGH